MLTSDGQTGGQIDGQHKSIPLNYFASRPTTIVVVRGSFLYAGCEICIVLHELWCMQGSIGRLDVKPPLLETKFVKDTG